MKKALPLVVSLTFASALLASGGMRFDAKTWSTMQTVEGRVLSKTLASHLGQLVALKFTFRSKDIHHFKPAWYETVLWQPDPNGRKGFSSVRVMVAKKDLDVFKSITTDSTSGTEITVYGRVLRDPENQKPFVQLLGRNTVVDPAGNAVVSW